MHPLSPLLRGGLALLVIAGVLLANFRDRLLELFVAEEYLASMGPSNGDLIDLLAEQRLVLVALLVALGVIGLVVFSSWLSWRVHTYRITEEAVEARSGILFRQHRRAPLERIQSVNLQRPLLARMLGLTQVDVQTAGQGGKVSLQYLGLGVAKEVREQILRSAAHRRGELAPAPPDAQRAADGANVAIVPAAADAAAAANATAAATAANATSAATAAGPREPAAQNDSATGLASVLEHRAKEFVDFDIDDEARSAGTLVTVPVGRLIGSILLSWDFWIPAVLLVASLIAGILWEPFFFAMIVPAALMVVGISYSAFNRGFNFTLSRSSDGVRVGAGLTATNTETIPFGRIHAIEARQPLGWRACGWWKVRVTTAGYGVAQGGQNKLQNVVLPVGHESEVLRVFETLLPGIGDEAHEVEALRQGLVGRDGDAGYLQAGPRSAWVLWFGMHRAGLRLEDPTSEHATLRIRRGALTRSFAVMPILRAQSVQLSRPLVQRFIGLASLHAHTVLGPVQMVMRGISLAEARKTFDILSETVVRVQGGEAEARHVGLAARTATEPRPRHAEGE